MNGIVQRCDKCYNNPTEKVRINYLLGGKEMKVELQKKYQLFIDGEWRDASDGETLKTYNPATGELLAEIADASEKDVDDAVKAGHRVFQTWSKTTVTERAAILNKIADIIDENK